MEPGDIVKPTKGRDRGHLMFVVSKGEDGLYRLADGKLRRVENPKKKKACHIEWVERPQGRVPDKIRTGEKVNNSELRRTLYALHPTGSADHEGGLRECPKTT